MTGFKFKAEHFVLSALFCVLIYALPVYAQSEKSVEITDEQALLVEGEPGFKKAVKVEEEEKFEKPKIYEHVRIYFDSMSNLLIVAGVVLVGVGIFVSVKSKKN